MNGYWFFGGEWAGCKGNAEGGEGYWQKQGGQKKGGGFSSGRGKVGLGWVVVTLGLSDAIFDSEVLAGAGGVDVGVWVGGGGDRGWVWGVA